MENTIRMMIFIFRHLLLITLLCLASGAKANTFHLSEFDYCMDLCKHIVNVHNFSKASVYRELTDVQIDLLNKSHSTKMNHFRDYHCAHLVRNKIH